MTKATDEKKTAAPVDQIDFDKVPVFITMRQTPTRNIIEHIQGDPDKADQGRADVVKFATEEAKRLKATIAVFGPQFGVIKPPVPADPVFVGMDFSGQSATKPVE